MSIDAQQAEQRELQRWLREISTYNTQFAAWRTRVEKIIKRYTDERKDSETNPARFNILWSNVQTLVPAVYARTPKPDVSRRFRDNDPVGRVAALIMERALEFEIEHYPDYRAAMSNCVLDRFLGGRGTAWVRYEPHMRAVPGEPADGVQVTEDQDVTEAVEEIEYECCPVDYVHWRNFGHIVARTWEEVPAVWREVYMDREALVARFGEEVGNAVPLDVKPPGEDPNRPVSNEGALQACVYEIWDKATGRALWLSKSYPKLLDTREDPLKLENFFPCPAPLFATLTTDNLIPTPDFTLYQDQARSLDTLAERIDGLINALKVRGVYDAAIPELASLMTAAGNNDLVPVQNWTAFSEKNGLSGAIDLVDIAPIAQALNEAYKATDQVKNHVYEIMGVADILRGATDAQETLGAQRLKGQFGSLRLRKMQGEVVRFANDLMQIKAQIMGRHFQPESLAKIAAVEQLSAADQTIVPQALALLQQDTLQAFRIEVSVDSMVQLDESQEKQDRMEFLKAIGQFMGQAMSLVKESPSTAPLAVELLKFAVAGFKVGKTIEGEFDQAIEQLRQQAAQPQPNAEQSKAQADAALEQQRMQFDMQLEQSKAQAAQALEAAQMQADQAVEAARAQAQREIEQAKVQAAAEIEQIRANARAQTEREKMAYEAEKVAFQARLNADLQRELAYIKKDAAVEAAQVKAGAVMSQAQDRAGGMYAGQQSTPGPDMPSVTAVEVLAAPPQRGQ